MKTWTDIAFGIIDNNVIGKKIIDIRPESQYNNNPDKNSLKMNESKNNEINDLNKLMDNLNIDCSVK